VPGPANVLPRTFAVVTGPPGSKLAVVVNQSVPSLTDGLSTYVAG
jgi:hypothetical protein